MDNSKNYSLLHIVGTAYRWRKHLLIFILAAALGSVGISLLLPNYYTAIAVFVPSNEEQKLFDSGGNLSLYGGDDAINRILVFSESSEFTLFMIDSFNLAERYDVDNSTSKGKYEVAKQFKKLCNVQRNKFSGLDLSIQDKDPNQAALMVKAALRKIEDLYRNATAPNKEMIKATYEISIHDRLNDLKEASDTLAKLRRQYNIYDVGKQSEALSSMLTSTESALISQQARLFSYIKNKGHKDSITVTKARIAGAERRLGMLRGEEQVIWGHDSVRYETSMNIYAFNEGRDQIIFFEAKRANLNDEITFFNEQFAKFKAHAYSNVASIILLEPVEVPNIKSYPIRSLIVIGSVLLATFLGLAGILFMDIYNRINWKEVLHEKSTDRP